MIKLLILDPTKYSNKLTLECWILLCPSTVNLKLTILRSLNESYWQLISWRLDEDTGLLRLGIGKVTIHRSKKENMNVI